MKSITIKGTKREIVGKVATKALRNADKVPCVIYGKKNTIHFSAEEKAFKNLVYTPKVYQVKLELEDGTNVKAIMQDIQFHPVTDRILHIDFIELSADHLITMHIPVILEGVAIGVRNGGRLMFTNRKLDVRALPDNMPDDITVDISGLDIGDKYFISQVETKDFELLHPEAMVIAQVKALRAKVVVEEVAEGEEGATEEGATEEGAETTEG